MKSFASALLAASALIGAAFPAAGQGTIAAPVILIVGLDLSASNPLITEGSEGNLFRSKSAKYVQDLISGTGMGSPSLPVGSIVLVRTFGDYNPLHQPIEMDVIPLHNKNRGLASEKITEIILNINSLMKKGGLQPQGATYIVGFLGEMALLTKEIGRKHHDALEAAMQRKFEFKTRVVLLSDGIENTHPSAANKQGLNLDDPRATKLPEPIAAFNQCDELVILGLGYGGPNSENASDRVVRLRRAWGEWSASAGCKEFIGKNQW